MSVREQIILDLDSLSEPQLGQVLDFVESMKDRKSPFSWMNGFEQDAPRGVSVSDEVIRQRREA